MDEFWLHPRLGTATRDGQQPRYYLRALQHAVQTLDADPRWRQWWHGSGCRGCELGIVTEGRLDHLRPSADIRRVDDQLRANFTCALPPAGTGRGELLQLAATEVRTMFEVIREAMALPDLPPTPAPSAPPEDADEVPVTARTLPSIPRELEPQGYLTLTQVQDFFSA
ncbi:hypothetical protein QLQ12_17845 [Actinoplanes sp. NEAU-A12]|uniref:Uncharacterized protein n=1 Tax=Actinoplanes sandaracinus TaxID=3045177 RepID=A0ABT6WLE9_9ACTN|nr:hypothetical protein [Actinoplanes sandaracinus]MDI6100475.1 hypothetical protein [Actinoplanes sandaracinus]